MEKVITIGEHYYELPPLPTNKDEILFVNEKKENAFWRRLTDYRDIWYQFIPYFTKLDQDATLYDQDENLITLNQEDSDYIRRIYAQEIKRRTEGVWFKNYDEFVHLTGHHYFLLQWAKMKRPDNQEYADYREFQRNYFYLIDLCWRNNYVVDKVLLKILGAFISKPKKTGITNIHWAGYYCNKATMTRNKNMGAMNLDEKICAKMFRDYFLYAFNGLPPAFKPQIKSVWEMQGSIIFGKIHGNSKKSRLSKREDNELNTSVFVVSTKPKAFDVAVMDDAWIDEGPKIMGIGEIVRTNKESVKIQDVFNGRFWMTSYTPDQDTQAFKEARKIFLDSELKTVNAQSRQTTSGMLCWHIPAYVSWEGCFNKHGKCDEVEALRRNQIQRNNAKGDARNLQAIKRQYANDKREAWASAGAGSTFDNIRIGELLADLEIDQRNSPDTPYIEGRLVWTNPMWETGLRNTRRKGEFCPVKFVPLTDEQKENGETGRLRIYDHIPHNLQNLALKQARDEWNNLLPPPIFYFLGAADPTKYAAASEVIQGSKNAFYTMSLQDERLDTITKKVSSKIIISEYFDRPELPDDALEDLIKEIIFFGKLNIVEANDPYMATRILEEGLGHYMIVKDENGILTTWKRYMGLPHEPDKTYQLVRTTANSANKEMLETIVRLIKNFIRRVQQFEKDYGKSIKSTRLLQQLMDFDPEDTTKYDLAMCFGYLLLCYETYISLLLDSRNDMHNPDYIASVISALVR